MGNEVDRFADYLINRIIELKRKCTETEDEKQIKHVSAKVEECRHLFVMYNAIKYDGNSPYHYLVEIYRKTIDEETPTK